MRITRWVYCLPVLCLLFGMSLQSWGDLGPLPAQNRYPLHLLFLTPRPTSAVLPDQGTTQIRTSFEYTRISMYQQSEQWQVSQDMELAVLELSLAYGLTSSLAFRLDIPIVSMNSGFLDPYVNRYHDALGVPSGGPENAFVYSVSKDSQLWLEGESGRVQLADITLSGQWSLLKAHAASGIGWYTTLLGTLKLPTGDARRGYGSGRMDAGVFGPTEWRWLKWSLYLMPGLIFHSDPDLGNVDVGARHSLSIFAGTSYNYNEKWQWLFQCNYFSSPLEHTGIAQIDDGAWEMTFGMRYRLRQHWSYEFGFSEDIFTRAAPDFTVLFSVIWIKEK